MIEGEISAILKHMNETIESTIIISILSLVVSLGVFVTSVTIFPLLSSLFAYICKVTLTATINTNYMMHVYSRRLTCGSYPQKQQQQLYLVLINYLQIQRTRKECSVCTYRLQKNLETVEKMQDPQTFFYWKIWFWLEHKEE